MGTHRKESTTDDQYNARHTAYLLRREKILATAKAKYQRDREHLLKANKLARAIARGDRLRQKRRALYPKGAPLKHDRIRDLIWDMKSHPCQDCRKTYPPYVMDFDHVRGEKKANISEMVSDERPLQEIQEEIDKCDVICSNCHRIRTYLRSKEKFIFEPKS